MKSEQLRFAIIIVAAILLGIALQAYLEKEQLKYQEDYEQQEPR